MIILKRMINRLAKEIDVISSVNPSHRLTTNGISRLEPLVQAINRLAARHEQLHAMIQNKKQATRGAVEEGKNILTAIISELPEGVLFEQKHYQNIRSEVIDFLEKNSSITIQQVRDLSGFSRKYILPILNKMDEEGITRRRGEERVLVKKQANRK